MRHGPADDRSPTGRDFDRSLTPSGRSVVESAGRALRARRGADLARVLSSPLVRARETAEIVRPLVTRDGAERDSWAIPSWPAIEVRSELSLDADLPIGLVHEVSRAEVDALVIGHQPSVEELCATLLGGVPRGTFARGFRTAMIVTLTRVGPAGPDGRWALGEIIDPHL